MSGDRRSFADAYRANAEGTTPVLALLGRYLPGRRLAFGTAVVSTLVWRLSKLVYPFLLGVAVDVFFVGGDRLSVPLLPEAWVPATTRGQFGLLVVLFAVVSVVNVTARAGRVAAWRWFQGSVLHELRTDAYEAVQRLDVAFFESEQTGAVMSVLTNDVNQLEEFLCEGLRDAVETAAFFVGLLAIMVSLHLPLTAVALVVVPAMVALVRAYQRVIEPRYDDRRSAVGQLNGHVKTVVDGVEAVKAATAERRERARLAENSRAYWRADWNAAKLSSLFFPARELLALVTMLLVVFVGGAWALFASPFGLGVDVSSGTFVTFYFYGQMFVNQSARAGDVVDAYTDANASAKRVFGLITYPATVADRPDATDLESVDGRVEYENVAFRYPDADEPAVRDLEFAVEPGEYVGVVGPTGAGKSTLAKLLLRFYDPQEGSITVDGVDLAEASTRSLRESVGYVSQEPFLFDGTVEENVAYGVDEADHEEIVAAAKRANAHEFVSDLPEGYDTQVGERGVMLSGGQRQRIAIARVILQDPDLLVLDEATSHVDNRTELLVQESLAELIAGRTTFAIAHRLSTVRQADRILVLEDGEIVERGTHERLLDRDELYADLWSIHVGESRSLSRVEATPTD